MRTLRRNNFMLRSVDVVDTPHDVSFISFFYNIENEYRTKTAHILAECTKTAEGCYRADWGVADEGYTYFYRSTIGSRGNLSNVYTPYTYIPMCESVTHIFTNAVEFINV